MTIVLIFAQVSLLDAQKTKITLRQSVDKNYPDTQG
jgi:hypothetical protein